MQIKQAIIATIAVMLFTVIPLAANATPKAVVGEYVFNAGEIPQGKTIIHDFIIRNTGDKPLDIKVKPC
jgi:hypothetical protein